MQVFVPFQDPFECAKALDSRRFNKQILECKQILKAIRGESTAWANHPCVLMYKKHADWLQMYLNAFGKMLEERKRRGKFNDISAMGTTGKDVFNWWMEYDILPGQIGLEEYMGELDEDEL